MSTIVGSETMLLEALKKMQVAAISEIALKPDRKAVVLKDFQEAFTKMVAANYLFFASMVEAPERFLFDGTLIATQLGVAFGIQSEDETKAQLRRLSASLEYYIDSFNEPALAPWIREHIEYYKQVHKKAMDTLHNKISTAFKENFDGMDLSVDSKQSNHPNPAFNNLDNLGDDDASAI